MSNRIVLRGCLDGYTSYGLHLLHVIKGFIKLGYDVNTLGTPFGTHKEPLPAWAAETVVHKPQVERCEMVIHCPLFGPSERRDVIYNTMWETTRLHNQSFLNLQNSAVVIVPSMWQAELFSAQGIKRPIFVAPMGIDSNVFKYQPKQPGEVFTFGAAGRVDGAGDRKRIDRVIKAFKDEFKPDEDVRLVLKTYPDNGLGKLIGGDKRISLKESFSTRAKLRDWYSDIDCFVTATHGEGWGLMSHETMAMGILNIAPLFGGHTAFMTRDNVLPVDYKLAPAGGEYKGLGLWADVCRDHLMARMREAYNGGSHLEKLRMTAASDAARLDWDNGCKALERIMIEVGAI